MRFGVIDVGGDRSTWARERCDAAMGSCRILIAGSWSLRFSCLAAKTRGWLLCCTVYGMDVLVFVDE